MFGAPSVLTYGVRSSTSSKMKSFGSIRHVFGNGVVVGGLTVGFSWPSSSASFSFVCSSVSSFSVSIFSPSSGKSSTSSGPE